MTLGEWFITLVATGVIPLCGIYFIILMESAHKRPPKKKRRR